MTAKGLKAMNIRTFDNFATAYQALRAGQTEASVTIDSTGAEYAKRGEFDRAISGLFPTPVALALKSPTLANAVVGVFNDMQKMALTPNSWPSTASWLTQIRSRSTDRQSKKFRRGLSPDGLRPSGGTFKELP